MKYFTDRPMERVMMQLPHAQRDQPPQPPEGHSCHGCGTARAASCPVTGV